jgi:hypothetical protein
MTVTLYAPDGVTVIATSIEDAPHKDVVASGVTAPGTYYAAITAGPSFSAAHSTYELFVELP